MPGSRPLPVHPSLRYLKLEAKRRVAEGEFPALHDAQAAMAREYGQPTWAALKEHVGAQHDQESHALPHLRWVITRFRNAGQPGWTAPGEDELRQHFREQLLSMVSADALIAAITEVAPLLRGELVITEQVPLGVRARIGGAEVVASSQDEPPYLLTGVNRVPLGSGITDPRVTARPPAGVFGEVPAAVTDIAEEEFTELGLVGLILAGASPGMPEWAIATGWANLERAEALGTGDPLPALGITALVTATAVLRLVADGRFSLDTPANAVLRAVRLADDTVTVRELLSYSSGIDEVPADPREVFADAVPDLAELTGPVIGCGGPRGVIRPTNSGWAVLGQLVADATGSSYADAAARLVLEPLGMTSSSFPLRAADIPSGAITGYGVTAGGGFAPAPRTVCVMPAAGGLWATAADLLRLSSGWASLLPAPLARAALTPQASAEHGAGHAGLGWIIRPRGDTAFVSGLGPDATASLSVRIRDNRTHLMVTSRLIPDDSIDDRMLRAWTNPTRSPEASAS
jgi:CubicO group peptidase (beta-lactamase class C family)